MAAKHTKEQLFEALAETTGDDSYITLGLDHPNISDAHMNGQSYIRIKHYSKQSQQDACECMSMHGFKLNYHGPDGQAEVKVITYHPEGTPDYF